MILTVDGKAVFAATGGRAFDAAAPAVVFVHGSGMDRTVWSLQTRYFAHHGHAVLALDLPGHGKSEGPALESIEAMHAVGCDEVVLSPCTASLAEVERAAALLT